MGPHGRGATTLQALRQEIGSADFSTVLRRCAAQNEDGNVSTADFVALVERVGGRQLDRFFETWLYAPRKPTTW